MTKRPAALPRPRLLLLPLLLLGLVLGGCEQKRNEQTQRIDQLNLKIQQLETRLNQLSGQLPQPDRGSKLPPGSIKSLTYRTTPGNMQLRIYWADGSVSDLECTQEQATLACG